MSRQTSFKERRRKAVGTLLSRPQHFKEDKGLVHIVSDPMVESFNMGLRLESVADGDFQGLVCYFCGAVRER